MNRVVFSEAARADRRADHGLHRGTVRNRAGPPPPTSKQLCARRPDPRRHSADWESREALDPPGRTFRYFVVMKRFVIVYEPTATGIRIARILHGMRNLAAELASRCWQRGVRDHAAVAWWRSPIRKRRIALRDRPAWSAASAVGTARRQAGEARDSEQSRGSTPRSTPRVLVLDSASAVRRPLKIHSPDPSRVGEDRIRRWDPRPMAHELARLAHLHARQRAPRDPPWHLVSRRCEEGPQVSG